MYTYYCTLSQEHSLKKRGKEKERNTTRRRKERSLRVSVMLLLLSSCHVVGLWCNVWMLPPYVDPSLSCGCSLCVTPLCCMAVFMLPPPSLPWSCSLYVMLTPLCLAAVLFVSVLLCCPLPLCLAVVLFKVTGMPILLKVHIGWMLSIIFCYCYLLQYSMHHLRAK